MYLDNKVPPFAVWKHVGEPAHAGVYFVPYDGETELVSRGEAVDLVEPEAGEEVRQRGMFSDDHTSLGHICHRN